jgi:hypothetical protein
MAGSGSLLRLSDAATPEGARPAADEIVGVRESAGDTAEEVVTKENNDRAPTRSSTYTLDPDPFKAVRSTYPSKSPV